MIFLIDDAFLSKWEPKYDQTEDDEEEYQSFVTQVTKEMHSGGTISEETFERIYRWKAERAVGRIDWKRYYDVYAPAFREAASVPPERKLASVFGLAGIRAPTGSTVLHFINPKMMPIIDKRTVGVLVAARRVGPLLASGRISTTKCKAIKQYQEFRAAISDIERDCPGWNLRQIDRALFAYHKQVLSGTGARRRLSFPAVCAT